MFSSLRRTLPRKRESATEACACVCARAHACLCLFAAVVWTVACVVLSSFVLRVHRPVSGRALPVWEANVPALKNAGDIKWQKIRSCLLACLDSLSLSVQSSGATLGGIWCASSFLKLLFYPGRCELELWAQQFLARLLLRGMFDLPSIALQIAALGLAVVRESPAVLSMWPCKNISHIQV